jgi:hypothetical protein
MINASRKMPPWCRRLSKGKMALIIR